MTTNESHLSILDLTDDDAHQLMTRTARQLATHIATHDINLIASQSISDDDTDYMPARAAMLARLIDALTSDDTATDALTRMIESDYFATDYATCDMHLALDDLAEIAALLD